MWKLKQFMPKETAGLEGRTIDIGRTKVQVTKALAEGGFSCVYIARDAATSKQYALKHMICNDEDSLGLIMKEISVMRKLKGHPNVVTLVASDILDMGRTKEAFLLMEFCDMSLVSVLESRGAGYYEEKQILLIFRDVCNAVFAMHCQSPPIAHRDLKAENLLLGSDGAWKLCDFGSTSTNHKCFDKPGEMGIEEDNIRKYTTPAYRAPEMWDLLRREVISEKVDIWALGCLLYRICYLKSAFDGESKLQILNGNYRIPELPKYSSSITDLIKDMLQASPDARPDITQVWFRVNLQLPVELQKEMPDGSVSMDVPDLHNASGSVHDEGAPKRTTVIPRRSPPPPPSGSSPQLAKCEQQHRTSLGSSKASGDGAPLGMFWATEHAPDNQDMKDNGPVFDKEPVNQWASKQGQHSYEKRGTLKEPPKKTDWDDSLKRFDDGSREDFEIRFDNDGSSVRTKLSHSENQKMKVPYPENKAISQNEAFNTFVAEFDNTKLNPAIDSNTTFVKELEAEVRMLKDQLKQSNMEKTEITSKYEKLSAICRSQRQEIQELKQALAVKSQSPPNKDSSRNPSTTGSLSSASQQREKIEGSVFELQHGVSTNTSPSPTPESKQWQPFRNEANPQSMAMPGHPKSVRTAGSRQNRKPSCSSVTTNSWGFEEDRFTAAPATHQIPKTGSQGSSREVKKVETTQPAGWAGF